MAANPTISMGAPSAPNPTDTHEEDINVGKPGEDTGQKVADMKEEDVVSAVTGDGKVDLKVEIGDDGSLTITDSSGHSRTFEPGATISEDGTITGTSTETRDGAEVKFTGETNYVEKSKSGVETTTKPMEDGKGNVTIVRGTEEEPATWSEDDEGVVQFEGKQVTTMPDGEGGESVEVFEGTAKTSDDGNPVFLTGTSSFTASDGSVVTLAWSDGEAISGDSKGPGDEEDKPLPKETLQYYSEGNQEAPDSDVEGEEDGSRVTD